MNRTVHIRPFRSYFYGVKDSPFGWWFVDEKGKMVPKKKLRAWMKNRKKFWERKNPVKRKVDGCKNQTRKLLKK